jgi:hypothetical protein
MPATKKGGLQVSDFQYFTPCFKWSAVCNLDWAAVAAVGGWAAAIATVAAVVVALRTATAQTNAARDAVNAERAKAEHIQQREWDAAKEAHRRAAKQLSHGLAVELLWAKRQLIARLISWNPFYSGRVPDAVLELFASDNPFSDLDFLQGCTDRLQGFEDEDAFALLRVLTAWKFFNWHPGNGIDQIRSRAATEWAELARPRVEIGLELLDLIDATIVRMASYRGESSPVAESAMERLPEKTLSNLKKMRAQLAST